MLGAMSAAALDGPFLAEPRWLAARLDEPGIRVVDARFDVRPAPGGGLEPVPGRVGYEAGHVPGAVFLDLMGEFVDPDDPLRVLRADRFEGLMGRLGIANDTEVVVYDDRGGLWAARLWWALRYYGHERVRLLDGGLARWRALGLPVERGGVAPPSASFRARVVPELRMERGQVLAALSDPDVAIVDALPEPFYRGEARLYPHCRAGHIPGACNVPAPSLLDPERGTLLPADALEARFSRLGLRPERRIVTYCGGGVFASFVLLALASAGRRSVALYDASWAEWGADSALPVETGPGPEDVTEGAAATGPRGGEPWRA